MIYFVLLQNRQGKTRLSKWYGKHGAEEEGGTYNRREKSRIIRELSSIVLHRRGKVSNFVEYRDMLVVYRRYAGLYFLFGISKEDNPLIILDVIHTWVEILDQYFGSVCELDLVYNFHKAYFILDELILGGHHQEPQKSIVLASILKQDELVMEAKSGQERFADFIAGDE